MVEAEEVVNNDIDNAEEDVANTEAVANLETVEKTVIGEEETVSNDKAEDDVTNTNTLVEANQETEKKKNYRNQKLHKS